MIFWRKRIQPQIIQAYLFYIQNVSCVCLTTTSLVLKKFFAYYHAIFSRRLNKFNDLVTGVGHNIESGKDFTVDGLSGFSKKKKKKRRHRWVSHPNLFFFFFVVVVFFFLVRWTIFFSLYYFFFCCYLFIYRSRCIEFFRHFRNDAINSVWRAHCKKKKKKERERGEKRRKNFDRRVMWNQRDRNTRE